jgi:transcriptional regulator with XRE-family HTH domain
VENWAREYVRQRQSKDPDFRSAWEKGAPALAAAKAVQQLRADIDVTQRGLADLTGIPQPQIARVERARGASLRTLFRLAFALGLEVELRFTGGSQAALEHEEAAEAYPPTIARVRWGPDGTITQSRRVTVERPVLRVEPDGRLDVPA